MRYYKITITDPQDKPAIFPSLQGSGMPPGVITSLLPNGQTNPAALNIEFDLMIYPGHVSGGDNASYIRIWGLSLAELSHAFNLANYKIKIEGGMAKGLPLANPSQQGLLVQGEINQAMGNWVGVDQTLDLFLRAPSAGSQQGSPVNYNFNAEAKQPLSDSITQALKTALPNAQVSVNISDQRIAPQLQQGFYSSFTQFAQQILNMTKGQLNANDQGVQMTYDGQTVKVFEGTPTEGGNAKQIRFPDIIGQITWQQPLLAQAKLVLRGDLDTTDIIQFPQGVLATTSAGAAPAFGGTNQNPSNNLTFGGNQKYYIQQMQHWGNFRQPDVSSWVTSVLCTAVPSS